MCRRDLVHALPGLEDAVLLRPGYAVEYDFIQPTELTRRARDEAGRRSFLAGQINGTSGYEEAAAQGLVAGVECGAPIASGCDGFELRRDEAYIGILVDDLITKAVSSRIGCSRRAPSIGCCCGSTTPTCG